MKAGSLHFIQHLGSHYSLQAVIKIHNSRQAGRQTLHIHTDVLICCNSSLTLWRHNQVLSPSCQSQCIPKLFTPLCFIYDYIFPCHQKVSESWFAGRNRTAKAFLRDRAAFIFHTDWEKLWDIEFIFCRQALSFIYSQYLVEILNNFLICKTFTLLSEETCEVGQHRMLVQCAGT